MNMLIIILTIVTIALSCIILILSRITQALADSVTQLRNSVEMLYKNITQNVFERLQNQAKEEIQIKWLSEKQKQHLQNIIDGIPPFGYSIKPKE